MSMNRYVVIEISHSHSKLLKSFQLAKQSHLLFGHVPEHLTNLIPHFFLICQNELIACIFKILCHILVISSNHKHSFAHCTCKQTTGKNKPFSPFPVCCRSLSAGSKPRNKRSSQASCNFLDVSSKWSTHARRRKKLPTIGEYQKEYHWGRST